MVTASYGHYGQHAAAAGPDRICRIRLLACDSVPFFQRRPGSYCVAPARIRSGWPHQVLAKRIWSGSKPVCKNHRAQFWQNTNGPLPLSHFQTRLHSFTDGPDHTVQNQTGSDWVLADCAGLIRKQASLQNHRARFWPTLPSRSGCFLGLSSIDH